jgi:hypothetical protein
MNEPNGADKFKFFHVCEGFSSKLLLKETDLKFHSSIKDEVV